MTIEPVEASSQKGCAEIRGVGAGAFVAERWQRGELHWVSDIRWPLLEPREGACRNIYAPSAVEIPGGWAVYYGAWDGVPTGNDRIYRAFTKDFLGFQDRRTVIEHGPFEHVCNVNALRLDDGAFSMVCTAYPDKHGRNKPIFFHSPDGLAWNGSQPPYTAKMEDLVSVNGYANYTDADINGMNVILHENGRYRLYFADFRNFGKIWHASGTNGTSFTLDTKVLDGKFAVNDVKKFNVDGQTWYLMGLHMNCDKLWYSLSKDPMAFPAPQELFSSAGEADRYMVALGWVMQGGQESPGRKILGVLFGAGSKPSLDANRIFARWLQKRVVLKTAEGQEIQGVQALGPDRVLLPVTQKTSGQLHVYAENGKTPLGDGSSVTLEPGRVYRLVEK